MDDGSRRKRGSLPWGRGVVAGVVTQRINIAFLGCCESHRASDGAPLLEVRVLTLDSGTVKNLDSWVPTDLNGPSWSPAGTLLLLRYD